MKRYIAAYDSKHGFEERYRVRDTQANTFVSEPLPYHEANDEAGRRNGDRVLVDSPAPIWAWAQPIPTSIP